MRTNDWTKREADEMLRESATVLRRLREIHP